MATSTQPFIATFADLHKRLGEVPLERILMTPAPGTATEDDVIAARMKKKRLCELVDGALVEKTMGYEESCLAILLGAILSNFVYERKLGRVSGADGAIRLFPGLVRVPDLAFVSRDHLPDPSLAKARVPELVPDLAVEILSESNTEGEMNRKLQDYFNAGTRLVWYFEAGRRTVRVYDSPDSVTVLAEHDILDGGNVLPGLQIRLTQLFARLNLED